MQTPDPNPTKVNGMYTRYFGDASQPPVILIHDSFGDASVKNSDTPNGGPSLNALYFEFGVDAHSVPLMVAQQLATAGTTGGFFVIVYDLRGQGRSDDVASPSEYNYKQYSDDLNAIIKFYNIQDAQHSRNLTIIGHSHGGIVALKFDEMNPGVAKKIILLDTPLDVAQTMSTIATQCQDRYTKSGETSKVEVMKTSLASLNAETTSKRDRATIAKQLFSSAATCGGNTGLYTASSPELPVDPNLDVRDPAEIAYASKLSAYNAHQNALKTYEMISWLHLNISEKNQTLPLVSFEENEDFLHVNEHAYVKANNNHIFGLYGTLDGLFDQAALAQIKTSLGADVDAGAGHMVMIDGASHNVFIDRTTMASLIFIATNL